MIRLLILLILCSALLPFPVSAMPVPSQAPAVPEMPARGGGVSDYGGGDIAAFAVGFFMVSLSLIMLVDESTGNDGWGYVIGLIGVFPMLGGSEGAEMLGTGIGQGVVEGIFEGIFQALFSAH